MFREVPLIKANAKIVIMRHAETVWNAPRKRIQGQSPSTQIMLSEKGKHEVVTAMAGAKKPDLLISSPLLRCKQTAETWFGSSFDKITIPRVLIDGLKEVDAGQLEGLYVDDLSDEPKKIWGLWKNHPLIFPGFPGGETLIEFQKRVLQAFSEICAQYGDQPKDIYVISHGGPLRVLKCFLENKDLSHLWDNEISNLDRLELTKDQIIKLQDYWQQHEKSYSPIYSSQKLPEEKRILPMKNFPKKYSLGNSIDSKGNAVLLETEKFRVIVSRDNQLVPGILRLGPKNNKLNNWDNWEDKDWEELLQTQRLIEFTLIEAFDKRDPRLKPTQDNKLVNFFGKQRRTVDGTEVYFDIAPRYTKPVELEAKSDAIIFEDKLYGKPFDFTNKKAVSEDAYSKIVATLRKTLQATDFAQFELNDDFGKKWDNCYSCKHPKEHPEGVGLVQVGKQGTNVEFSMALDSRSQEEKGRAFCDSDLHIPALRYWEDVRMTIVGELFKKHIHTVNAVYPSPTGEREFDLAILMNLAKSPEGTHTHGHFIPRTPGSVDYGTDFQMDPKKYVPLTKEKINRKNIVNGISDELVTRLTTNAKLQLLWAHSEMKQPVPTIQSKHQETKSDTSKKEKVLENSSWSWGKKAFLAGVGLGALYIGYSIFAKRAGAPSGSMPNSTVRPKL